jgi:hypothetical protein
MNMARKENRRASRLWLSHGEIHFRKPGPRERQRELYLEKIYLAVMGAQIGHAGQEPEMDPGRVTRLGERTEMNEGEWTFMSPKAAGVPSNLSLQLT